MNFDDYERLPTPSVATNMTAGAIAGVFEHCIMYPMDSVKTRMQSLSPISAGQTIISTFNNMVKNEGYTRPIRGMTAVVAGAGPAHAFYFATYEYTKETMTKLSPQHNQINYIISAVTATLIHDAISNPTEVIKQRLQMYGSPYKTVVQCARGVYQKEGIRAFYRSYNTQLIMNLPYQAIHFSTYEFFQNMLNRDHKYNPPVHVIAGGAAGAAASAFTTPLDVIKTLLNTQETGIGLTKGMREAVRQIYTMAGPLGFFKGIGARVLYSMPATAICWSTYEFAKFILSRKSREDYTSSVSTTPPPSSSSPPPSSPPPTTGSTMTIIKPKDVISCAAEKVRLDDSTKLGLRYVLPMTSATSTVVESNFENDAISNGTESLSSSSHNNSTSCNNSSNSRSNSNSSNSSNSISNNNNSGSNSLTSATSSIIPRELPSMSGASVYSGLSLNTMHSSDSSGGARNYDRGCNR